jgi:hypothetical protein
VTPSQKIAVSNEEKKMGTFVFGLKTIVEGKVNSPLNEWPDHIKRHTKTLMGKFLFDFSCFRC